MTTVQRTPERLVLRSGSTTLALDRKAGTATRQRKILFWTTKPMERPLADVIAVNVDTTVDRASGVELCSTVLVMRDGSAWALPHSDKKNATEIAATIRDFLGIPQAS